MKERLTASIRKLLLLGRKLQSPQGVTGVFYATYFEVEAARQNLDRPHDHLSFAYTQHEMALFGTQNGWVANYIGPWGHPRGQVMMKYQLPNHDDRLKNTHVVV